MVIKKVSDVLNEDQEHGSSRELLPLMAGLSNNSRLTQEVAAKLADHLPYEVFQDLVRWLQHAEREQQFKLSQQQNKRW